MGSKRGGLQAFVVGTSAHLSWGQVPDTWQLLVSFGGQHFFFSLPELCKITFDLRIAPRLS